MHMRPSRRPAGHSTGLSAPAPEDLDTQFKGFADPRRARILTLLAVGERCVCDLVAVLHLPQPPVSRHLTHLPHMGLVRARRDLKYAYYRLAEPTYRVRADLLRYVRTGFSGIPPLDGERARAAVRARRRAATCR